MDNTTLDLFEVYTVDENLTTLSYGPNSEYIFQYNQKFVKDYLLPPMIYLGIIILMGTVGNLLVVYTYGFRLHLNTQNFLTVILAVYDLMSSLIVVPGEIIALNYYYTFHLVNICRLARSTNTFCTMASILTLTVIAVDRFRRVCRPLKGQISLAYAKLIALMIVPAISILFSIPSAFLFGIQTVMIIYDKDTKIIGHRCIVSDKFKGTKYPPLYFGVFSLAFFVVLIILVFLYFKIWGQMKRHRRINKNTPEKHRKRPNEMSKTQMESSLAPKVTLVTEADSQLHDEEGLDSEQGQSYVSTEDASISKDEKNLDEPHPLKNSEVHQDLYKPADTNVYAVTHTETPVLSEVTQGAMEQSEKIQGVMEMERNEKVQGVTEMEHNEKVQGVTEMEHNEKVQGVTEMEHNEKVQDVMEMEHNEKIQDMMEMEHNEKVQDVMEMEDNEKVQGVKEMAVRDRDVMNVKRRELTHNEEEDGSESGLKTEDETVQSVQSQKWEDSITSDTLATTSSCHNHELPDEKHVSFCSSQERGQNHRVLLGQHSLQNPSRPNSNSVTSRENFLSRNTVEFINLYFEESNVEKVSLSKIAKTVSGISNKLAYLPFSLVSSGNSSEKKHLQHGQIYSKQPYTINGNADKKERLKSMADIKLHVFEDALANTHNETRRSTVPNQHQVTGRVAFDVEEKTKSAYDDCKQKNRPLVSEECQSANKLEEAMDYCEGTKNTSAKQDSQIIASGNLTKTGPTSDVCATNPKKPGRQGTNRPGSKKAIESTTDVSTVISHYGHELTTTTDSSKSSIIRSLEEDTCLERRKRGHFSAILSPSKRRQIGMALKIRSPKIRSLKNQKGTIIATLVALVFFLSFFPNITIVLLHNAKVVNFESGFRVTVFHVIQRSYLINTIANPIIYGFLNTKFRVECARLWHHLLHCKLQTGSNYF